MSDYRSAEVRVVDESGDTFVYKMPAGYARLDSGVTSDGIDTIHEWSFTFRFVLEPGSIAAGSCHDQR